MTSIQTKERTVNTTTVSNYEQVEVDFQEAVSTINDKPSALSENLYDFFDQQGWKYKVLGRAEMPEAISYAGNWVIVPSDADATDIPDHAMDKVTAIFAEGFRPKGFLLVHEITTQEASKRPKSAFAMPHANWFDQTPKRQRNFSIAWPNLSNIGKALAPLGEIAFALLKVVAVLAAIALGVIALISIVKAILTGAAILFGLFVLANMAGLDPILVVVTDDNYWIEIDRWVD